ncbi:hypothetical protein PUN28_012997 [Cardiocondyla obscurior]|uniref:Uncharacterized protein n=1 Tax=Cardiocondyla obscurior TaxID=286306 RepID=A0AAW2FBG0_9HYME
MCTFPRLLYRYPRDELAHTSPRILEDRSNPQIDPRSRMIAHVAPLCELHSKLDEQQKKKRKKKKKKEKKRKRTRVRSR